MFYSRWPCLPLGPSREPQEVRLASPRSRTARNGQMTSADEAICASCSAVFTVVKKPGARPKTCPTCRAPKRSRSAAIQTITPEASPEVPASEPERPLFVAREYPHGPRSSDPTALAPPPLAWEERQS